MASVSQASVTAANAVVTARATQAAAVAALTQATAALHAAAFVYRQSMAADGVQPGDQNAPIALTIGDSSGNVLPELLRHHERRDHREACRNSREQRTYRESCRQHHRGDRGDPRRRLETRESLHRRAVRSPNTKFTGEPHDKSPRCLKFRIAFQSLRSEYDSCVSGKSCSPPHSSRGRIAKRNKEDRGA